MGIVIKNVHLLDEEKQIRRDVYIEGNRITGIDSMPEGFTADEMIDGTHRLLMPGLVNAHTHAYMSVFRNYADDLPFAEWLFEKIDPLEGSRQTELIGIQQIADHRIRQIYKVQDIDVFADHTGIADNVSQKRRCERPGSQNQQADDRIDASVIG